MSNDLCETCQHPKAEHGFPGCLVYTTEDGFCACTERHADVKDRAPQPEPSTGRTIPSRTTDPGTSHQAAQAIKVKAGTQRAKLLLAFLKAEELAPDAEPSQGLTDEEAMEMAVGVSPVSEFAKRCSELRDGGLIKPTGETRPGNAGVERIVSILTPEGRTVARGLGAE